jgi:hypothetical protein
MSWPGLTRLDPAIQPQDPKRWNLLSWMATSEGGHDMRGFRKISTRFSGTNLTFGSRYRELMLKCGAR